MGYLKEQQTHWSWGTWRYYYWLYFTESLRYARDWVLDRPCWRFNGTTPYMETTRTRRRV
jgi:hypothetical protein